jgi:hypothetical protein
MRQAREVVELDVPPAAALRLWTDTGRWPTFVDGFGHVVELHPDWPKVGSTVVWESIPAGRGRVTERVVERTDDSFVTAVYEERLTGRQSLFFAVGQVAMQLDYELARGGPFAAVTDFFFIRRALEDMLRRTLARFSTEAVEEASL